MGGFQPCIRLGRHSLKLTLTRVIGRHSLHNTCGRNPSNTGESVHRGRSMENRQQQPFLRRRTSSSHHQVPRRRFAQQGSVVRRPTGREQREQVAIAGAPRVQLLIPAGNSHRPPPAAVILLSPFLCPSEYSRRA